MSARRKRIERADLEALAWARARLEHPSFAVRLCNAIGSPLEQVLKMMPKGWQDSVHGASREAIHRALQLAIFTLARERGDAKKLYGTRQFYNLLAATSGAVGGFFGLPAVMLELPVTTTIMLRAIADIARHEGENLQDIEARLACVEVFALGSSRSHDDDAAETGYFGVRFALAHQFSTISEQVARRAVLDHELPITINAIRGIAARFGIVTSERAAALAVPFVGGATGALVNAVFMEHYHDVARGHFTVRRLERVYGADRVRDVYERGRTARPARSASRERAK